MNRESRPTAQLIMEDFIIFIQVLYQKNIICKILPVVSRLVRFVSFYVRYSPLHTPPDGGLRPMEWGGLRGERREQTTHDHSRFASH